MYPFFRFSGVILKARFRKKIELHEECTLNYRVGLSDMDMFLELNNARYFNYMELGRWDYAYRVGFLELMKSRKLGLAVGGASIRYRRRIPLFNKFSVTTKLICHDGRWFYFLHEFHMKEALCASALMKVGAVSKRGLVPATEVIREMGEEMDSEIPDWIAAWIEAEGLRPWSG